MDGVYIWVNGASWSGARIRIYVRITCGNKRASCFSGASHAARYVIASTRGSLGSNRQKLSRLPSPDNYFVREFLFPGFKVHDLRPAITPVDIVPRRELDLRLRGTELWTSQSRSGQRRSSVRRVINIPGNELSRTKLSFRVLLGPVYETQ